MTDKQKSILTDFLLGLPVVVLVIYLNRNQGYPLIHLLCDGFFVASVMLLGSGGLVVCRNKGAFDMMGYGVKSLIDLFSTSGRLGGAKSQEDYPSYCQRKASTRKPSTHLLVAGAVYLALAMVCLLIYSFIG